MLPATSWLEETGYKASATHLYLMDRALPPRGEARSCGWVLDQLARRLGVDDLFPWASPDELLDELFDHDATGHARVADLRAGDRRAPLAVSAVGHPMLQFPTPSGRVEFRSETAVALGNRERLGLGAAADRGEDGN